MILDALTDAALDTVKLLPFLFVTYLFMEYLEHLSEDKSTAWLKKSGKLGPVIGAVIGILPQCGFSAAAASLFSGGVITLGTLIAVFLSTSDEMLPIFISEAVAPDRIAKILFLKAALGLVTGVLIDLVIKRFHFSKKHEKHIHDLCEHEHCGCEDDEESDAENHHHAHGTGSHESKFMHIAKPALWHTLQITLFIFLITLVITLLVEGIGEEAIGNFLTGKPVVGVFLSGLIGLIPNCAASVALTELYLLGMLTTGQMMAGLLVGAGVGLLVLFRTNDHPNENLGILALLYICGVAWGLILELLQVNI